MNLLAIPAHDVTALLAAFLVWVDRRRHLCECVPALE